MNEMVMKLDQWGQPAWLGLMVLSFVLFWPFGLAVLAFLIWSGRMGCGWHGDRSEWKARMADRWSDKRYGGGQRAPHQQSWGGRSESRGSGYGGFSGSGNAAFDEYREATLKRLEDEQREFREYLERLRLAKDRSEFDQFVADRKNRPPQDGEPAPPTAQG